MTFMKKLLTYLGFCPSKESAQRFRVRNNTITLKQSVIWKGSSVVLFAAVLLLSVMYSIRYNELMVVESELDRITSEHGQLTELVELCTPSPYPIITTSGIAIRSSYLLQFNRRGNVWYNYQGPTAAVFYNWLENSTLELEFAIRYPKPGLYAPLTLQTGNAFLNESATICEKMEGYEYYRCHAPVLWEMNATESGTYPVPLTEKGWYTLSLSGKIVRQPGGGTSHEIIGVSWVNGTSLTIEGVYIEMGFRIIHEDRYIPFAMNEIFTH